MQKSPFTLGILFFLVFVNGASGQTLVSQMGPVQFFNSLDSVKSAKLTRIAGQCFCMIQLLDSTHSIPLKLDLAEVGDSVFYLLDFNNLEGNYIDSSSETPGIYIKARDSILRSEIILRLLDYGVQHYSELLQLKKSEKMYDKTFAEALLKQKPLPSFKKAMGKCK